MRVLKLSAEARRIEARKRELGLDDARTARARNKGAARTRSKRALLRAIEVEARRQGRPPPFTADA